MKKLLSILILICFVFIVKGQNKYPTVTFRGNPNTLDSAAGSIKVKGAFINGVYADTTAANSSQYFKYYDGAQVLTTTSGLKLWGRYNNTWVLLSGGGSSSDGWLLAGNPAIDNSWFLGTTTPFDLNVGTNNLKRFAIKSSGILPATGSVKGIGIDSTSGYLTYTGAIVGSDTLVTVNPLYVVDSIGKQFLFDSAYFSGLVVNDSTLRLYKGNGDSSDFVIKGVGKTYTGNAPITVTGTVISADTSTANTGLATKYQLGFKWDVGGNAASSSNFLGTTNAQKLRFRVNNTYFGFFDSTSTYGNIALGYNALPLAQSPGTFSITGQNQAFGTDALANNSTGWWNTAIQQQALFHNTTGFDNIAIGNQAGFNNTSGIRNVFIGNVAGASNTTGVSNTYLASHTGQNATGSGNTFVGAYAGQGGDNGIGESVAVGYQANFNGGYYNTTIGVLATSSVARHNVMIFGHNATVNRDSAASYGDTA